MTTIQGVALQAARETGATDAQVELLGLRFDETPVLRPSTDYRDGNLYMTVPIERDVTETVGRGKAAKEVTKRVWTMLAVCDDGTFFLYDEEDITTRGFRVPPMITGSRIQRWHPDDLRSWLAGERYHVDPAKLYDDLRAVYLKFVEYPDPIYYDIVPLFVLTSYVFRLFKSTGYIHFNGTAASGKSQNLRVLSALALNPIWASNMSPSSLFRTVAGNPGVLAVDEAESFEGEQGQEIRKLLLAGYAEGSIASRTERGKNDVFEVVHYEVYSPKVLASINTLDTVLASRCLIIPMAPAIRKIPDFAADAADWVNLRSRLYRWAMQEAQAIAQIRDSWDLQRRERDAPDINSREWEIAQGYLTLAEHVRPGLEKKLIGFFNDYFKRQSKSREDADRQYLLLKCLPRVLSEKTPHPGWMYSLKDIHAVVSSYLEEDAREYYKTKTVGRHLTVLGFKERKAAKGGTLVPLDETFIRTEFAKRHVTPFDEDAPWFEGELTYQSGDPRDLKKEDEEADDLLSQLGLAYNA